MPDTYPSEAHASDAALMALEGAEDSASGVPMIAYQTGPDSSPPLRVQLDRFARRLQVAIAIAEQGRVCKETTALKIGVKPIDYILGGTAKHYAGATNQSVTNATVNYVYIDSSNALVINTTGYPADLTTHIRLGQVTAAGGVITAIQDDRGYHRNSILQTTSSSDSGTNNASFIIDEDNAGAGADTQVRFNRGTDNAEDAAIEWDETNDRINVRAQHSTSTLAPVNCSKVQISGTDALDSNGAAKVAAAVAGDGLQHSGGVLSAKTSSALGTSVSASGIAVDPSDGIAIDANGVRVSATANGGLEFTGTAGSQTIGVDTDDSTIELSSGKVAIKDLGVSTPKLAVSGSANGAVPVIFSASLTGGNTVSIHSGDAPFKYKIIRAWSIARSADAGTWKIDDGTNAITDTVAVTATDKTVNQAAQIDDAYQTILAAGSMRVVGDGSLADVDVYIEAIKVT